MSLIQEFGDAWAKAVFEAALARGLPREIANISKNFYLTREGTYMFPFGCSRTVAFETTLDDILRVGDVSKMYKERTPLSLERFRDLQQQLAEDHQMRWLPMFPLEENADYHFRGNPNPPLRKLVLVHGKWYQDSGVTPLIKVTTYEPGFGDDEITFELRSDAARPRKGYINYLEWFRNGKPFNLPEVLRDLPSYTWDLPEVNPDQWQYFRQQTGVEPVIE